MRIYLALEISIPLHFKQSSAHVTVKSFRITALTFRITNGSFSINYNSTTNKVFIIYPFETLKDPFT